MLRITINDEPRKLTLKLEGKIMGPWVEELDRTWHSIGDALQGKTLSIDLCGVSYIDREGRAILAEIYRRTHARFEADTPLTEYFAQEARTTRFSTPFSNGNGHGNGTSNGNQHEKGASK